MAVAEQVIAQIDRDRDGAISNNEAAAYAKLLKRDLTLRMDGRKLELKLTASEFVPPAELRTGSGTIQMEFSAISGPLAAGPHRLTLENRHLTAISVYLINAAQPKFATVQITRQKRNENQSAGEIEFTFQPLRPKIAVSGARVLIGWGENKQDELQFQFWEAKRGREHFSLLAQVINKQAVNYWIISTDRRRPWRKTQGTLE